MEVGFSDMIGLYPLAYEWKQIFKYTNNNFYSFILIYWIYTPVAYN